MSEVSEQVPDAPSLNWCVGRTRTTATWTPVHDQSWSAFVRWLKPDQPASSKEVNPYVGGTLDNGRRSARTVGQRFFLTLDADYAEPDFPMETEILLHDVPYLIHTTWRHTIEEHRYRLIIPLSRGVTPNEHKELAWIVMNRLGADQFDKTTAQAERFMWGPSTQAPAEYFYNVAHAGLPYLPVNVWLDGHHSPSESPAAGGRANTPPHARATASGARSASHVTEEDIERAEEILASAVDDVLHLHEREKFAGRNEAVFHLLPTLLRFADAGALDEDLVLDSLFNAAQQVVADEPYTRQEFDASARSARAYADEGGPITPETTATKLAQADFADVEIEEDHYDELWSASPQLKHIAQAADNIACSRSALLAATLMRILVQVDPSVQLAGSEDGSVGSRASLNLGTVLIGASGQGKSVISDKSLELVPGSRRFARSKMATGQGLIQAYLRWNETAQRNELIDEPQALFWFDEIDVLAATSADSTSTLLGEIRTMMTGGHTGTQTATASRQRDLPARSYNLQLIINAQPSRTGVLLSDRDGGTPQRFLWTPVLDPQRVVPPSERPAWPGPLNWNDAFLLGFELGDPVVDIPQWLKTELLDYDYRMRLEGMEGGALSRNSHKNLLRLKVAVGIAFLHESPVVTDEHVRIADFVVQDSYRIQNECERIVAKAEFGAKLAKVRSDHHVIDVVGDEKLGRLTTTVLKKLKSRGDWVNWRDLRPQYHDRAAWEEPLWDALGTTDGVEVHEEDYGEQKRRKARWVG